MILTISGNFPLELLRNDTFSPPRQLQLLGLTFLRHIRSFGAGSTHEQFDIALHEPDLTKKARRHENDWKEK